LTAKEFDPTATTVAEIHERICEDASWKANEWIADDAKIPSMWRRGYIIQNVSPYNNGQLSLAITDEYSGAPPKVKKRYREHARRAIKWAIVKNQELFVGMIFGEARAGRNYFQRWQQAPTQLFD
jgi:hypothetical protein